MGKDKDREDTPAPPLRLVADHGHKVPESEGKRRVRGPVLENGLTAKQERFAQEVAKGKPLSEAYRIAYDAGGMRDQAIWTEASKLMSNPKVSGRVTELRKVIEAKTLHDAGQIRSHVLERLMLESINAQQDGARLRALELLGKLDIVGMFRERSETEVTDKRSADQVSEDLRRKLETLFKAG